MRYSSGFKESQVKKILPPGNRSVASVATETGVSEQTLRNWLQKAKEGTLRAGKAVSGSGRSAREKLHLVIESGRIPDEQRGRWLREKGLHTEHLTQYEQELRDLVEQKNYDEKQGEKALLRENRQLKRELRKKEKALAEMAALYTLKKKAAALWGAEEDD